MEFIQVTLKDKEKIETLSALASSIVKEHYDPILGAEQNDYEVYKFILKHYYSLQFSPTVATVVKENIRNPKRMQRDVRKQLRDTGIGTKSQQALKLQQEQNKQERKVKSRERKLAESKRMLELKQQKKKEKHRGR